MSIVKDVDYNIDQEIKVGNSSLRLKGALTAPLGFAVHAFLGNIEAAATALQSQDPQQKLPFGKLLSTEKFNITADKPVKGRKFYEFTVKMDISGEHGFEEASTVHALAQTLAGKPCVLEIVEKPQRPAARPAGEKKQPEATADQGKAGKKGVATGDAPIDLMQILPSRWVKSLARVEITTADEISAFGDDAEKLAATANLKKVDDAREIISIVKKAREKAGNGDIPLSKVEGIDQVTKDLLAAAGFTTVHSVTEIGAHGLMQRHIDGMTFDQATEIERRCCQAEASVH